MKMRSTDSLKFRTIFTPTKMKTKITIALLSALLLSAIGGFLYVKNQNQQLKLKIDELVKANGADERNQVTHAKSQNPFDNPNTDPLSADIPAEVKMTIMSFETTRYDFGKITEGDKPSTKFRFTNNGKEPLIVTSAVASCGCTVANYPRGPVAPGESSQIDVVFDSKNKIGEVAKTVTVTANSIPVKTVLTVKATVMPH